MPSILSLSARTVASVFASGIQSVGELLGFLDAGIAPGIVIGEVARETRAVLHALGGTVPIFADSGAFSEIAFTAAGPQVIAPISDEQWSMRLAQMLSLAEANGPALSVVAPDRVGDQVVTLQRLAQWRDETRALHATGAHVLMPLQQGAMSLRGFYDAASEILGFAPVPALPMKKSATPASEAIGFLMDVQPPRAHFLGLGLKGRETSSILTTAAQLAPHTRLTLDACLITAMVGRSAGLRPYTAAQDAVRDAARAATFGELSIPAWQVGTDYTEQIAFPSEWTGATERGRIADRAGLDALARRAFVADPDAFLQADIDGDPAWLALPALDAALNDAWADAMQAQLTQVRKALAIRPAFADHPAAGQFTAPAWVTARLDAARAALGAETIDTTAPLVRAVA
jgi:hypothetical protein